MGFYNPKNDKEPKEVFDKNMLFYIGLLIIFGWINIATVLMNIACLCYRS